MSLHLKCMAIAFSLRYLRKFPPSCAYLALKIQVLPWSSHTLCWWQDFCPLLGEAPQHWACVEQVAHIWGIKGKKHLCAHRSALGKPGEVKHTTYPFKGMRWLTLHHRMLGLNAIYILVIFCFLRSHTLSHISQNLCFTHPRLISIKSWAMLLGHKTHPYKWCHLYFTTA